MVKEILIMLALMLSGCATSTANYPLKPHIWNKTIQKGQGVVIYCRYAYQMPRSGFMDGGKVNALGIWEDVATGAIKAGADAIPKMAQSYSTVRNSNSFSNVEILIYGAKTPEDLVAVKGVLEAIGKNRTPSF